MDLSAKSVGTVAAAACVLAIGTSSLIRFCRWLLRGDLFKRRGNIVKNFKPDHVYLFNFPTCETIPTISPFALKVETWLRLKEISYECVRGTKNWSRQGQIPFIELNGEEINESTVIIKHLQERFQKPDSLSQEQAGIARAVGVMLDSHTSVSYFYYRYVDDPHSFIGTWRFIRLALGRWFIANQMGRGYKKRATEHGLGRNSKEVVYAFGCQDLKAASDILGDKSYLFGDEMTVADCSLFAHLCQILYIPVNYPHKKFLREEAINLCEYAERIKENLWPDWDKICEEV